MVEAPGDQHMEIVNFLLVPGFPMMGLCTVTGPLQTANEIFGRRIYDFRVLTPSGAPERASSTMRMMADAAIDEVTALDAVIVCAGPSAATFRDRRVFGWLRRQARRGARLGAICSGSWLLARAGLLTGYRATIHWKDAPLLRDEFPGLDITGNLYEIDRSRFTCSGGTSGLDMTLALIARSHGRDLAGAIAEELMHHPIRDSFEHQRISVAARTGVHDPRLAAAVGLMEGHVEEPLPLDDICARSSLSRRHIERLFKERFGRSPIRYYGTIRLRRARHLLLHSALPVSDIALATGYASFSHFGRSYKREFGRTPAEERRGALAPVHLAGAETAAPSACNTLWSRG